MTATDRGGSERGHVSRADVPRWAVIGVFLILCVHAIAYARDFLMPVVLAVLLALVFSPLRRGMGRIGIGPGPAAAIIVTTLLVAIVGTITSLAAPARGWVNDAPEIGREIEEKMRSIKNATEGMRQAAEQVDQITSGADAPDGAEDAPVQGVEALADGGSATQQEGSDAEGEGQSEGDGEGAEEAETAPGSDRVVVERDNSMVGAAMQAPFVLGQMVLCLVMLFFLLASGDMFYEKIVHAIPRFRDKRRAIKVAYDIERKLSFYLFTITLVNAGLGLSIGLTMWLLGMPNPVLFGLIGFLFNYVPYLGAIVGVAIAFAVGVVTFVTVEMAFLVAGAYFALTSIEGQLVTPYFVGRNLKLNTVVVFLSVTFWAWLWSVVGMLVAMPLLVAIRTLCEHIPSLRPVGFFLSGRGVEREQIEASETAAPQTPPGREPGEPARSDAAEKAA